MQSAALVSATTTAPVAPAPSPVFSPSGALLAPALAEVPAMRDVTWLNVTYAGAPQWLWRTPPTMQYCRIISGAPSASCKPIPASITDRGRVHSAIASFGPGPGAVYLPEEGASGGTSVSAYTIEGSRIGQATLENAFIQEDGTVIGVERGKDGGQRVHQIGGLDAGAPTKTTVLPSAQWGTAWVLGRDVVSVDSSFDVAVRSVQRSGTLTPDVSLGRSQRALWAEPCQSADGTAAILFLPQISSAPKSGYGFLRDGNGWTATGPVEIGEPFGDGVTVWCGDGRASATEVTRDHLRTVRCARAGCEASTVELTGPSEASAALTLGDRVILLNKTSERAPDVVLRTSALKDANRAPAQTLACEGAGAGSKPPHARLVSAASGAFVVVHDDARLCAFFVDRNGKAVAVQKSGD